MNSALFILDVVKVDPGASSVTFRIRCTQSVRRMAISRLFVLRVLAWRGRGDYAVCRALKPLLAPLSMRDQEERLDDWEFVDRFIAQTRVTAIENYIDWENIDHDAALAKMLVAMKLPTSYDLEVTFSDAAYVDGFKVGDSLETDQADGWISGVEEMLAAEGDIYGYKRDDEHWRLHDLLATYNTRGEHVIAWSNAQDSVLAVTKGLLPWQVGDRWGAVDADGATRIKVAYQDVDYQDGRLVFKEGARWIPADELE